MGGVMGVQCEWAAHGKPIRPPFFRPQAEARY
jgi:hypothetical protein